MNHKLGLKGSPIADTGFHRAMEEGGLGGGATYAGGKELVDRILDRWLDFDEAIATPEMADEIQRVAKILYPIGLMPFLERRDHHR